MTPPPHRPEPLESLRARYPAAIARAWTVADLEDLGPPPARVHAFDFAEGVRLTVLREHHPGEGTCVHVVGSAAPGLPYARAIASGGIDPETFAVIVLGYFAKLSGFDPRGGDGDQVEFGGYTEEKGCPHWYFWEHPR